LHFYDDLSPASVKTNQLWLGHILNFLAVILGVYLAFAINEQSKRAGELKEARQLMESMAAELKDDTRTFREYHIPINEQYEQTLDSLILALVDEDVERAEEFLPALFQIENYVPSTAVFNSMKSSGKIRLIEDLELQKKMSDFFDGTVLECTAKNTLQADFFLDNLIPWLLENSDLLEMSLDDTKDLRTLKNILLTYQSLVSPNQALPTHSDKIPGAGAAY
jgi:hypothetical protein